jgi:hypothetical protein
LSLTVPVADTSRTTSPAAKAAADGSWAVKVEARDASAAMDLRIGRGAREMLFPEAPDVPGQDFRVSLVKGEEKVSEYIQPMGGDWQGQWSLRAAMAKGAGGLSLRLGESTREIPVWLADAAHLTAVPLSKDQSLPLSEADLQANDYHLVAGDKDYLVRGRTVWEKTVETGNSLSYTWDGHDHAGMPLPAGIYNLSLTAKPEGKPAYRAVRNLLRM